MIRLHYLINKGIRKIQWTCQKLFTKDHLSSPEVFNAGSYIARYAYPRIKKMRANLSGFPCSLESEQQWIDILDEILFGLQHEIVDSFGSYKEITEYYKRFGINWEDPTTEDYDALRQLEARADEAMLLFGKYFKSLWD